MSVKKSVFCQNFMFLDIPPYLHIAIGTRGESLLCPGRPSPISYPMKLFYIVRSADRPFALCSTSITDAESKETPAVANSATAGVSDHLNILNFLILLRKPIPLVRAEFFFRDGICSRRGRLCSFFNRTLSAHIP